MADISAEDINGLSKDYVVISLALFCDAKAYPNDKTSWRLTPQRVGRTDFNTQREPPFSAYASVRFATRVDIGPRASDRSRSIRLGR